MIDAKPIRPLGNGVNQKGLRGHNERLILSVLQRCGEVPGSEIARRTQLSAQTVSVILRKLEGDGLVIKCKPVKGKVGKPSVPMALNPMGAASIGVKVGRRSSEFVLSDLCGAVVYEKHLQYPMALPKTIFEFLADSFADACVHLGAVQVQKLCGVGIAAPFEIWKWGATDGNTPAEFLSWKDVSFEAEVARFTELPVFMVNDATSACWAEHVYGVGKEQRDYAYFYVSTFIGGGVVLNNAVYEGTRGNAAAFGPLRVGGTDGRSRQLLDIASVHALEDRLTRSGQDPRALWKLPQDWTPFAREVDGWIEETAHAMSQACVSVCAVIDFPVIVVDGYFPTAVRDKLVEQVRAKLLQEDSRGLMLPQVVPGTIGFKARAVGAACIPIFAQYFLNPKSAMPE